VRTIFHKAILCDVCNYRLWCHAIACRSPPFSARSRNRAVKPQARPCGEHDNGDNAPHQRDSDQAGEEAHRPDCPCNRSRDQQRTEYDYRDAGDHSTRFILGSVCAAYGETPSLGALLTCCRRVIEILRREAVKLPISLCIYVASNCLGWIIINA